VRRGGGTFVTGSRPLGPGDSYVAEVYSPRPTVADMRDAGSVYPEFAYGQVLMGLPARVGGPVSVNPRTGVPDEATYNLIAFPLWGQHGPPRRITPNGVAFLDASRTIAHSDYARMYRLARRLRAQASSPYDLVQRVSRRVRRRAIYTEAPPPARVPLDAFLFTDHQGYCQQFSGAMALLLRMAGVPARVAAGFAPGRFDQQRKEYVVRDLDAHSWVEVYFPRIGWVPFDPTPASAPPSSQASSDRFASAAAGNAADAGGAGDRGSDPRAGGAGGDGGRTWVLPAVFSLVALIAGLGAFAGHRRTRPPVVGDGLDELRLVLQRTGRPLTAEITLQRLEQRMAGDARAYVRALRLARYGGGAPAPTALQRAALRRELAEGLGVLGRLRAWSALPPRPRLGLGRVRRRQV
jgi:transglutaminase-like putative cysteine protease